MTGSDALRAICVLDESCELGGVALWNSSHHLQYRKIVIIQAESVEN